MDRGSRLKILRMLCGQSQDGLAKDLGLSQGNVATWERKGMFPRDHEIARKLAELLQAPIGYLAYGDSQIDCAVWVPQPPQNPRHLKSYLSDIKRLIPEFLSENRIDAGTYISVVDGSFVQNGIIVLLGQAGRPLSYLVMVKLVLVESFLEALEGVKIEETKLFHGYPDLHVDFDEFELGQLELIAHALALNDFPIDSQALGAALVKKFQNIKQKNKQKKVDVPHSVENAFRIFHGLLQEYEVPQVWSEDLMVRLSYVFMRLHEQVVEKPLVGEVMRDETLEEYIAPMLAGSGLKKRDQNGGSTRGSTNKLRA